jgi:hypothetical protein
MKTKWHCKSGDKTWTQTQKDTFTLLEVGKIPCIGDMVGLRVIQWAQGQYGKMSDRIYLSMYLPDVHFYYSKAFRRFKASKRPSGLM